MGRWSRVGAALAAAVLLAGCGGGTGEYATVTDLRDAAIEAGYPCPEWQQSDHVKPALSSGTCSDRDVFAVYPDSEAVQGVIDGMADYAPITYMLHGDTWAIIGPEDALLALQKRLGGDLVEG